MTARSGPSVTERLRIREDQIVLRELLDRYLYALDRGTFDESEAGATFTDDIVLAFPPGTHQGFAGLNAFTDTFMGHWARTHHQTSNYLVDVDGDQATVTCSLLASHIHAGGPLPPASGDHFHLGGRFEGVAARTPEGWRLRRLTLTVDWMTDGGAPAIVATMSTNQDTVAS